jgi:predicted metalloprotease with PDZ domain
LSLVEAGAEKSTYNAAVYDGGWLAAYCWDLLMREASVGERGMDDLLRGMYRRFASAGDDYGADDLVAAGVAIGGEPLREFFEQHVDGTETIPVDEYLSRGGFDAVATVYSVHVRFSRRIDADQLRIRQRMFAR